MASPSVASPRRCAHFVRALHAGLVRSGEARIPSPNRPFTRCARPAGAGRCPGPMLDGERWRMSQGHIGAARSRRRGGALAITAVAMVLALGALASGAEAATFKVTKQTDPAGDTTPFTFHVTFAPQKNDIPPPDFQVPADFTLTGGQSRTFTVHKGFYTITEMSASGWRLARITCDNGGDPDPADAPKIDVGASKATLELSTTENKGCTFENAKLPPSLAPPAPPSTSGSPAPPQPPGPAAARGPPRPPPPPAGAGRRTVPAGRARNAGRPLGRSAGRPEAVRLAPVHRRDHRGARPVRDVLRER